MMGWLTTFFHLGTADGWIPVGGLNMLHLRPKACQGKGHRLCREETRLDVCRTCLVGSLGPGSESDG